MRRLIVTLVAAFAALAVSACSGASDPPTYRYRLTVEVETPEGLRTGSSVIEVQTFIASSRAITSPGAVRMRARGEAVAVDMPDGRTLFALLRSENEVDWAGGIMFLLAPQYRGDNAALRTVRAIQRNRSVRELPFSKVVGGGSLRRDGWPMLVTFDDIDDPTSVAMVDPLDLAATFGEGVELKRITVQITDDPVTIGIEERLEWVGSSFKEYSLADFPEGFPVGDFGGLFKKGD